MKHKTSSPATITAGSVLLSEKPFVYVLKNSLRTEHCDYCFRRSDLQKCSGCGVTYYCDRSCQKGGWNDHRKECKNLKRIYPKVLPDAARMLAKIIFKLEQGGATVQGFYSPNQFRVFMDLMSHYQDIKDDAKRMEHIESLAGVLEEYLGNSMLPNPVELIRIYGKMVVNTFSILNGEMQSIGIGMYLGASIIDHSCDPNAVAVFDGTTLYIRTLIDLPSVDFNKVFISYIDILKYPEERQQELQSTYYFLCQCKRCLDVEELNVMTATVCQNKRCNRDIPGGAKELGCKCGDCGEVVSHETWEELIEISEFTTQQLSSMKDVAYLDVCRTCLKKQDGLFAEMNLNRVRVLEMAMDSSIELGHYESALHYGRQLINPFRKYYGQLHPLAGIFFLKMGKLALLMNSIDNAKEWLKEAATALLVTHGKEHPLVREELRPYLMQAMDSTS